MKRAACIIIFVRDGDGPLMRENYNNETHTSKPRGQDPPVAGQYPGGVGLVLE